MGFKGLRAHLRALAEHWKSPTAVYFAHKAIGKALDESDVTVFYQLLRHIGRTDKLYLVLNAPGGDLDSARRVVQLLRTSSPFLCVAVPSRAHSASTMLALASDKIVLTPTATLSPIDPILMRAGTSKDHAGSSHQPHGVSSEDVRRFMSMAEHWFDVRSEAGRLKVLELLSQKFFPSTLSRFYRAEQFTTELVSEMLTRQLPEVDDEKRLEIARGFVHNHPSHTHSLTIQDLKRMGVNVHVTDEAEEDLLTTLDSRCNDLIEDLMADGGDLNGTNSFLFSSDFFAYNQYAFDESADEGGEPTLQSRTSRWKVLGADEYAVGPPAH